MDAARPSYEVFTDFVRRFNQVELLTAVARVATNLPDSAEEEPYRHTPPWALAGIVKASICNGNRFRYKTPTDKDVRLGCAIYNNLTPELDQPELANGFALLARMAYEQFPLQESIFEELARVELFFSDYSGRKKLEIVSEATLTELLGAPVRTAVAVALVLYAAVTVNAGFFNPSWLDQPNFAPVLEIVPRDEIVSVIETVFAGDIAAFKEQAAEAPPLPYLDRYLFNPLAARPLIRLADGRLLAPVPQMIGRKLSPIELYYQGIKRWDVAFAHDLGELLEDYVGRQLRTLPDVAVHSEITYLHRKVEIKSVDWIVVFDDLVLLVEAKATRVPAAARAAHVTAKETYIATLGKAFKQINRTLEAFQGGEPAFAHIPKGLPVLGMVATLDPWYMANCPAPGLMETSNTRRIGCYGGTEEVSGRVA